MPDSPHPVLVARRGFPEDRLDSWKEIAAYLGREVRTVQGWEKSEGLPIHRHQHARQGSVYAFRSELNEWRDGRRETPEQPPAGVIPPTLDTNSGHRMGWRVPAAGVAVILAAGLFWGVYLWNNRSRNPPPVGTPSSVVVLPFLDLSPQKDQEYFSDGLTEEIIDALSRVPNLRVVARTSAFAFKGRPTDIRQIGQQLNVTTVLEGSVRKSGDELRITAQLNRASDGYHLWSRTYDRPLRDIFAVQREISQAIADQLQAGEVPHRAATTNLDAYRLYQEGRYFFNQHQVPESYRKAIDRYQQAIAIDPAFALAYAGLADANAYLAEQFVVAPREVMPKAKAAAEKAVALDDTSAEAHTSLGLVKLDYDWDREGAQREFRRAMQLNPNSGYARHWYAHSLETQGRLEEAMQEMRASQSLDPFLVPLSWDIAIELLSVKRYDDALRHLAKADELFPNLPLTSFLRAQAFYRKGDPPSARRVLDELKSREPDFVRAPPVLAVFGVAAMAEGRRDEARRILDELDQRRLTMYVDPVMTLELCSVLNDHRQRVLWLQRGYDERSTQFVYLGMHKDWYSGDPEAEAIVARAR